MRKYILMAAVAAAVAGVSGNAMAEIKVKAGGRIMVDGEFGRGINGSKGFEPSSSAQETDFDSQLDRARLNLSGTVSPDWGFKIEYDFASGKAAAKDIFLAYKGFKPAAVLIGNFKEPFGLEELTSSKYMTFMDRTIVNGQFSPSRNVGAALHMGGSNYSAAFGVFGKGTGKGQDPKYSVAGRVTFAPIATKTTAVHLGAAVNYIDVHSSSLYTSSGAITTGDTNNKEPAGYHIGNPNFVDLDKSTLGGLEAAAVFGPASIQGEYMKAFNTYLTPGRNSDPSGWYVQASFFPTGESRNYVAKKGAFGRIKTSGNAIELAARYGVLKLDQAGRDDVKQTTVGANWYANPHLRFMANYEMVNYGNNANAGITAPQPVADNKDNFFMARAQVDW